MPEAAVALLVTADEASPVLPDATPSFKREVAAELSCLAATKMSLTAPQYQGAR